MMAIEAKALSGAAVEMLGQLFVNGPTWDGNVVSKQGRGELFAAGLAFKVEGFTSLTEDGLRAAIEWKGSEGRPLKDWHDKRWYKKQNGA